MKLKQAVQSRLKEATSSASNKIEKLVEEKRQAAFEEEEKAKKRLLDAIEKGRNRPYMTADDNVGGKNLA